MEFVLPHRRQLWPTAAVPAFLGLPFSSSLQPQFSHCGRCVEMTHIFLPEAKLSRRFY